MLESWSKGFVDSRSPVPDYSCNAQTELGAVSSALLALQGPAFDPEVRRHQGRAFGWIERMLTTRSKATSQISKWGPSKNMVARMALKNLLSSNHDVIDVSLDQCYSAHAAVSRAYFQVQ